MITSFKQNPGINPAALPEWRKVTKAINELERHRTIVTGKIASGTRTAGATIQRISAAVADVSGGTTDTRVGTAPTALTATATGYYDSVTGNPSTQVALSWTAPATYSNGDPFTASGYEIWRLLTGGEWQFVTRVAGTAATLLRQPFAGATYQFEVRAQSADNGLYGDFSAPVTVTPPTTLTPLSAPSAPTLTTTLGTVRATWDGLLGGAAPPAGFRGVYAVVSADGGTTWTQKGQNLLFAGAQSVISGYANGTVLQVRFRAVDALGVNSADSSTSSITVVGVSGPDITTNSITTNQIASGQITTALLSATAIDGMTVTGAVIQTSATASRGIKLSGTTLQAFDGSGNATLTVDGSTGAVTAVGLNATTATISGAITATSGAITGTMTVSGTLQTGSSGARVVLTSAGLTGYNSSGTATFQFLTSSGVVTATGGTFTGVTVTGAITATSGSITGTLTIGSSGKVTSSYTFSGGNTSATFDSNGFSATSHTNAISPSPAVDQSAVFGGDTIAFSETISGTKRTEIYVGSNGNDSGGTIWAYASTPNNGVLTVGAADTASMMFGNDGSPRIWSPTIYNRRYVGASADVTAGGSTNGLVVMTSAGTLGISNGYLQVPDAYSRVVSTRAAYLTNLGTFGTTSSSRRVKKNIRRLEWDEATMKRWLDVKPMEFEYRKGVHADGDVGVQHGFIAEDVHDAGFRRMVYYDDRPGSKTAGRVDGFAYERMGVYDHLALGVLYDELMSLRKRVAALEGA